MANTVDITSVNLAEFAKAVYELSVPQGMGFFRAVAGPLSDEDAQELVDNRKDDKVFALDMDYVHGRTCKMHVRRDNGKLIIDHPWYDHTDRQLQDLLGRFGLSAPKEREHSVACNCVECRT